jgi:iron complex outermembrane receptor protein
VNSFYLYQQVYDEGGSPIEGEYVDVNGDGVITIDDKVISENPAPDVFLGFFYNLPLEKFNRRILLKKQHWQFCV